jgi:hypothetical protein
MRSARGTTPFTSSSSGQPPDYTIEVSSWSVYLEMDYGFGKLTVKDEIMLKFE